MHDASPRDLGVKIAVQAWREVAIGISQNLLLEKYSSRPDEDGEDGDLQEDEVHEM